MNSPSGLMNDLLPAQAVLFRIHFESFRSWFAEILVSSLGRFLLLIPVDRDFVAPGYKRGEPRGSNLKF